MPDIDLIESGNRAHYLHSALQMARAARNCGSDHWRDEYVSDAERELAATAEAMGFTIQRRVAAQYRDAAE